MANTEVPKQLLVESAETRVRRWRPDIWRSIRLAVMVRRFAAKYFAQLDVEFESLCDGDYKLRVAEEVRALRDASAQGPSWNINHRYEYLLLQGLPFAVLQQRAHIHRARLFALVGTEGAEIFNAAYPPVPSDPIPEQDQAAFRTQAAGVLLEVQRLRHVQSEFERLRNRLISVSMFPGFVFAMLALRYAKGFWHMDLATIAAILGFLGGYLSVLLRIGSLRWALRYAANYQQVDRLFWNLFLNFYLSLLEGCLGAIVLYIALSAGVLTGSIFPALPGELKRVLVATDLTHHNLTLLMLWSIVAGFSERAVPDFLSGFSKELVHKSDVAPQ